MVHSVVVCTSQFGVSTVPFRRYSGVHGGTGRYRGTERYSWEVQSKDEIGRYNAEVQDCTSVAELLERGTDRYAGSTARYSGGQPLIGSGPAGLLLDAYAAESNSRVHNCRYNC